MAHSNLTVRVIAVDKEGNQLDYRIVDEVLVEETIRELKEENPNMKSYEVHVEED